MPADQLRILFLGDVFGRPGCRCLEMHLAGYRRRHGIDVCIANGENAAGGNGITPKIADRLFASGVDVITSGDHVWDKQEFESYLDRNPAVTRPANFTPDAPGRGTAVWARGERTRVGVINLVGRVFMRPSDSPFAAVERALEELGDCPVRVVDFHAEATSEKMAMGFFLDGRVSAVLGTHTHVQTADAAVLPGGTAYITDAGMTGPALSVIGLRQEEVLTHYRFQIKRRFVPAGGPVAMQGVRIEVDRDTGRASSIVPVRERYDV